MESTYEGILRLVRVKAKYGVIPEDLAEVGIRRIEQAREMANMIDRALVGGNAEDELARLKPEINRINAFPNSEKIHLELSMGKEKLRYLNSVWALLSGK